MWQRIAPGRRIGPYELVEQIGRGGSAVVYLANDRERDRRVAIKLIAGAHASDESFRTRFLQEAHLISRLHHPHILPVYESGETEPVYGEDGIPFLVSEYMPGSLAASLRPEEDVRSRCVLALTLAQHIGSALDWAHQAGVLHRDVKPSNVLIAADGRFVLGDFGLARVLAQDLSLHLTVSGLVAGTPAYMAPEQALGEPADSRTDLYGLGVVLYEIVGGKLPFHAETPLATMLAHVHQPPPALDELDPRVPAGVQAVLERALAKGREERYQSGADLANALHFAVADAFGEAAVTTGTMPALPSEDADTWRAALDDWKRVVGARATGPRAKRRAAAAPFAFVRSRAAAVTVALVGLVGLGGAGSAALALGPGRPVLAGAIARYLAGTGQPGVTDAWPALDAHDLPLQTTMYLHFNRPMNRDSVESALHLEPAVPFDTEWQGQTLVIKPRSLLESATSYRLLLDASAEDATGHALPVGVMRRFTTMTAPVQPPPFAIAGPSGPARVLAKPTDEPLPSVPAVNPTIVNAIRTVGSSAGVSGNAVPSQPTHYAPPTIAPLGPNEAIVAGATDRVDDPSGLAREEIPLLTPVPTLAPTPPPPASPTVASPPVRVPVSGEGVTPSPSPAASSTPYPAGTQRPVGSPTVQPSSTATPSRPVANLTPSASAATTQPTAQPAAQATGTSSGDATATAATPTAVPTAQPTGTARLVVTSTAAAPPPAASASAPPSSLPTAPAPSPTSAGG